MAISPNPAPELFFWSLSFLVYFLLKKIESTIPQMMHTLIRSAIVVKAVGVISAADRDDIPTCSAAASAICVS